MPTASSPEWHLDHVDVTMEQNSSASSFFFGGILRGPKDLSTSLSRTTPLTPYDITLTVAGTQEKPFDGELYITLNVRMCVGGWGRGGRHIRLSVWGGEHARLSVCGGRGASWGPVRIMRRGVH